MAKEYAEMFKRPDLATGKVFTSVEYFIITRHKDYRAHLEKILDVEIDESAELMDRLDLKNEIFDYELNTGIIEVLAREGERQITEFGRSSIHVQPTIGLDMSSS
jgi:hypothetical protein